MKGPDRDAARRVTPESAERLIRSLVGVANAAVRAAPDGSIDSLVITPEPDAAERQVLQNVTSALIAGLGLNLDPARIRFSSIAPAPPSSNGRHPRADGPDAPAPILEPDAGRDPDILPGPGVDGRTPPAASTDDVTSRLMRSPARGPASPVRPGAYTNGRPPAVAGAAALAAVDEPLPDAAPGIRLELVELRRHDDRLRCRVVLALGAERFLAVAEAPDLPGAALELPARAATDALRAARVPDAPLQFEGAAIADIAGRTHVVVSLRIWTGHDFRTATGAAAASGSIEEAAAAAILQAATGRT